MPFSGGSGTSGDPYLISTPLDLWNIRLYLSAVYQMVNDIDLAYLPGAYGGPYWTPVGQATAFTGVLDGRGFNISNLKVKVVGSGDLLGLFAKTSTGAVIKDVNLIKSSAENTTAVTNATVGFLVALVIASSSIENCNVTGALISSGRFNTIGGLVGAGVDSSIDTCEISGVNFSGVTASLCGGLAGALAGDSSVTGSFSTGTISGSFSYLGGLIGEIHPSFSSYKTFSDMDLTNSSTGSYTGGFIGISREFDIGSPGTYKVTENCYAQGSINSGTSSVQTLSGFIGVIQPTGGSGESYLLTNSYSAIDINPGANGVVYGFAKPNGSVEYSGDHSFYDSTLAGVSDTTFATPLSTAAMKNPSTFTSSGWDFNNIWVILNPGNDYPTFGQSTPIISTPITDPKILIRWRNDGKSDWTNYREINLGDIGQTEIIKRIRGLGQYRTRQYEIVCTSGVPLTISGIEET